MPHPCAAGYRARQGVRAVIKESRSHPGTNPVRGAKEKLLFLSQQSSAGAS